MVINIPDDALNEFRVPSILEAERAVSAAAGEDAVEEARDNLKRAELLKLVDMTFDYQYSEAYRQVFNDLGARSHFTAREWECLIKNLVAAWFIANHRY